MTARPGLTLIEMLLSLVILSAMVALSGVWLVSAARTSSHESRRSAQQLALQRAVLVLQRDLDQAADGSIEPVEHENGLASVQMVTCHQPGQHPEDSTGWIIVTWSVDAASGSLIRAARPAAPGSAHRPVERRVLQGPVVLACDHGPSEENGVTPAPMTATVSIGQDQAAAVVPARRLRIKEATR